MWPATNVILVLARLILASTLGFAACAKAFDSVGTQRAIRGFGVPNAVGRPASIILPLVEALLAASFVPASTAWHGAVGAVALFIVFQIAIAGNLLQGRKPDCHCFGQLHSAPISWWLFARNLVLLALACGLAAAGPDRLGPSLVSWFWQLSLGEQAIFLVTTAVLALATSVLVLLRRLLIVQKAALVKIEELARAMRDEYSPLLPLEREDARPPRKGIPIGAPAPSFNLSSLRGNTVTLDALAGRAQPILLLFVSPTCIPCRELLPLAQAWERDYREHLTVVLITKGNAEENRAKFSRFEFEHLLLPGDSKPDEVFRIQWTPAAVLIGRDLRVQSLVASGVEAIKVLVEKFLRTTSIVSKGPLELILPGQACPDFSLANLQGTKVMTEELRGRPHLLLFWDEHCQFCQEILPDLRRYAREKADPRFVFIVTGTAPEESPVAGSLVLLDEELEVSPLFGGNLTPSAVLLDSEGSIASSLGRGPGNVLALLGVHRQLSAS